MDPVSQATLGAVAAQSSGHPHSLRAAAFLGCVAGLAPDIDVFIKSPIDPLLFLEFHRQFTHSLVFIPFGALLCSALFYVVVRRYLSFKETFLFCLLGYATHGLLDACTTYGTQLLWPFSDVRIAWNNVSVIDPLLTLPALAFMVIATIKARASYARIALAWIIFYLLLGLVQKERAEFAALEQVRARGHHPVRLEAKPGFANLLLWKIVYEFNGMYYVDAVRVGFTAQVYAGDRIEKLDIAKHLPWLDPTSQQAKDIERFRWFSDDYLAVDPRDRNLVVDMRYSVIPNEIDALWGIRLDPHASSTAHVGYRTSRNASSERLEKLKRMLYGEAVRR
ncbi:metal-dependent hydrolase [Candidatus Entotheonella serta]|nr:metal-dependent hydrolase [Candidatus Entotheonella serta]